MLAKGSVNISINEQKSAQLHERTSTLAYLVSSKKCYCLFQMTIINRQ